MNSSMRVFVFGLLASSAVVSFGSATKSITGFTTGVDGGISYNRMKPKESSYEGLIFEDKAKGAMSGRVGGFVGYGAAFDSGLYVGAQLGGGFQFGAEITHSPELLTPDEVAKRKESKPSKMRKPSENSDGIQLQRKPGASAVVEVSCKPRYYYNASLQLGYAFVPQCVVYGLGGFEGQFVKTSLSLSGQELEGNGKITDKEKCSHVPYGVFGVGFRYLVTNHLFVGLEAKALFGSKKEWKVDLVNEIKEGLRKEPQMAEKLGFLKEDKVEQKFSTQDYTACLSLGFKF